MKHHESLLVSLGRIAASVARASNQSGRAYPVLGAEGDDFFVEIADGEEFMEREILRTIYVTLEEGVTAVDEPGEGDFSITIPNASYLVALFALLQSALNASKAKVLHPLDSHGNYLPAWNQAVIAASVERPS
jgi:hypothetical protein